MPGSVRPVCVLCRCVGVHQRLDCGSVTLCRVLGQGAGAVAHTHGQSATANIWEDISVCMAEYAVTAHPSACMCVL